MYALGEYRSEIIRIAKEESDLGPWRYGKVTDYISDPEEPTFRRGWRRLKEYFDMAVIGWGWQWNDSTPRSYVKNGEEKGPISYLEGVQKKDMRVPQDTAGNGINWCGIFGAGVVGRAFRSSAAARWASPGIIGGGVGLVNGNRGIQPGDVVVFGAPLVHHCIVYGMDEAAGKLLTINGNSDAQSILHKEMWVKDV